nr:MAG TPA: hypothetical protein [Caudoviricetes sp.]
MGYTQGHERRTTLARPEPEAAAATGNRHLRLALLHLPHDDQPRRNTAARPTEHRPCAARQPRRHRHDRKPPARPLRLQCRSRRRLSHRPTPTDRNRNRIFSNGPRPGPRPHFSFPPKSSKIRKKRRNGVKMPLFDLEVRDESPIHDAVKDLIEDLEGEGLLDYRTKLLTVVMLSTAKALDRGLCAAKVSVATTQLARQLLDGIEMLPKPPAKTGSVFDTLQTVIEAVTARSMGL